jgi:hypothetical protein
MTVGDLEKKISIWNNDEENYLKFISNPEYNKEYIIMNLVSSNLQIATYNIVIKKDFYFGRNCFYKAGLLKMLLHEKFDKKNYTSSNVFLVSIGFAYSILSDSHKLISKYLEYEDDFLDTFGSAFAKAIQACVKGDDSSLQLEIDNLERHTGTKSIAKNYSGIPVAFKGILFKDKMLVELGISEILAKHSKQDQPAILKDFMSIEALTLAKLAYRKDIIVELDNSFLPKEMIPVKQLEEYESYDFLKELESTL